VTQNDEHPVERKKSRWWPPRREATRIFVALVAVGALLVVFRGYYIDILLDSPLTVLRAATVVAAVVVLIRIGQHYEWTGFGNLVQPKPDNEDFQPRKTLWDWLQLLIVPLALVVIGLIFTMLQDARQQDLEDQRVKQAQNIENQRAKAEQELAVQRAQDEALQAYLDQVGTLLLEKDLRNSEEDSEVRTLARARTLTVLGRLDPARKTEVMQFLVEAKLIQSVKGREPIIRLVGADLRGTSVPGEGTFRGAYLGILTLTNLSGAHLSAANLSDSNLSGADLSGADLSGADLRNADLIGADLRNADLIGANLSSANLIEADLRDADLLNAGANDADLSDSNLSSANLIGADLRNADLSDVFLPNANLSSANMSSARGITEAQLQQAKSLAGATMPDGQTLKSDDNPAGPTPEEWLKSKGREENGKNDGSS
jgi:uncharacterized protein YjbI with pentapeptide repeats